MDYKTDKLPHYLQLETMAEQIKIIEVLLIEGDVLVTFSDGRIVRLEVGDIYMSSVEPPSEPNRF